MGLEPFSGEAFEQPSLQGIDPDRLWELTRSARRMGFQAVVKPFFRLALEMTEEKLCEHLEIFTSRQVPLLLPPLVLRFQDNRFYLEPHTYPSSLISLAADCIRTFDPYGMSPKPSESARLRAAVLSPQEKKNLELWGYPYVFNQYRFRLVLTSRVTDPVEKEVIYSALVRYFSSACAPSLTIDALCLFVETGAGQPMRFIRRFDFPAHQPEIEEPTANDNPASKEFYSRYQRHSP